MLDGNALYQLVLGGSHDDSYIDFRSDFHVDFHMYSVITLFVVVESFHF